jgi:alpha-amylase
VQKNVLVKKDVVTSQNSSQLEIKYQLQNLEQTPIELWFAIEFNFALLAGNAPDRYFYFPGNKFKNNNLSSIGIVKKVSIMGLKDEWQDIDINFSFEQPTDVWRFPIETISQSEAGFEKVYQNSVVLPNWKLNLAPESDWEITILHNISKISKGI